MNGDNKNFEQNILILLVLATLAIVGLWAKFGDQIIKGMFYIKLAPLYVGSLLGDNPEWDQTINAILNIRDHELSLRNLSIISQKYSYANLVLYVPLFSLIILFIFFKGLKNKRKTDAGKGQLTMGELMNIQSKRWHSTLAVMRPKDNPRYFEERGIKDSRWGRAKTINDVVREERLIRLIKHKDPETGEYEDKRMVVRSKVEKYLAKQYRYPIINNKIKYKPVHRVVAAIYLLGIEGDSVGMRKLMMEATKLFYKYGDISAKTLAAPEGVNIRDTVKHIMDRNEKTLSIFAHKHAYLDTLMIGLKEKATSVIGVNPSSEIMFLRPLDYQMFTNLNGEGRADSFPIESCVMNGHYKGEKNINKGSKDRLVNHQVAGVIDFLIAYRLADVIYRDDDTIQKFV